MNSDERVTMIQSDNITGSINRRTRNGSEREKEKEGNGDVAAERGGGDNE